MDPSARPQTRGCALTQPQHDLGGPCVGDKHPVAHVVAQVEVGWNGEVLVENCDAQDARRRNGPRGPWPVARTTLMNNRG
jgi:hypothetical protein